MGKIKEFLKDVRDKILGLHKTISNKHGQKMMTVGEILWKSKKYKMTISRPRSGAPCNALSHGVRIINRKVVDQPKARREGLVIDMKTAGTTLSKNTIGNTLRCNRQKTCSARMVPMFKKPHVQAHLKFAGEPIIHSEKCCSQIKPKLSSLASTRFLLHKESHLHSQTRRWKHYALGSFSAKSTGQLHCIEGPMNRPVYHKILDKYLLPSARTLKTSHRSVFQHGNDPKNTA